MSFADDIAGDFAAVVDNLETVTFRRRGAGDSFSDTGGVTALRRALERSFGSGNSALAADSMVWHLEASDITSKPKQGDRIKDAAEVEWVIGRVSGQTFLNRWRCETTKYKNPSA